MDLLATVRKEGSRGGRGDFKWSDVESSSHRENYLGHSLMAPVGRWQKGRDLNWYAKAGSDSNNDEDPAAQAARERKEEIRRVKQAEEDALARALGLPVAPRDNPNMEELGAQREIGSVMKEVKAESDLATSRGVGYGRPAGVSAGSEGQPATELLAGTVPEQDQELDYALKEYKRRHGDRKRRSRSRSRHRHREHHERKHRDSRRHHHRDHRSRSPRRERLRSRSRSPSSSRDRGHHRRKRARSNSPPYRSHGRSRTERESRDQHEERYDRR